MKNVKCIKCKGDDIGYYDHVTKTEHFGEWNSYINREVYTQYICRSKSCNFEWKGVKIYPDLLIEEEFGKEDVMSYLAVLGFFAFLLIFIKLAFLLNG